MGTAIGVLIDSTLPAVVSEFHQLVAEARQLVAQRLEALACRSGWPVVVHRFAAAGSEPKRFLEELSNTVRAEGWDSFLYVSGGTGALIDLHHLTATTTLCGLARGAVVSNNLYSCDILGLQDRDQLDAVSSLKSPNDLAWALRRDAGLAFLPAPYSELWDFDVDTPADLSILAFLGRLPQLKVPTAPVQRIADRLIDPSATLLIVGRVSSKTFRALDTMAKCQVRLLSEERGMKASGREVAGTVRSVLFERGADPAALACRLLSSADALVLDTRVLVAATRWETSAYDLFAADLFATEAITSANLRTFLLELKRSGKPVLVGGHNLVNSGLRQVLVAATQPDPRGCTLCVV